MALGKTAIANARTSLNNVKNKVSDTRSTNKSFKELFDDPNFKVFVKETNKGAQLNQHLTDLANWIDQMSDLMDSLSTKTDTYLTKQESYNE